MYGDDRGTDEQMDRLTNLPRTKLRAERWTDRRAKGNIRVGQTDGRMNQPEVGHARELRLKRPFKSHPSELRNTRRPNRKCHAYSRNDALAKASINKQANAFATPARQ